MLYKYRNYHDAYSKERLKDIIINKRLFFAGVESFNDPFDGRVYLRHDGTIQQIKAAQTRVQYAMKLQGGGQYEGINIQQAINLVNNNFTQEDIDEKIKNDHKRKRVQEKHNEKGVLSLASNFDNILMWSHYSFNHCIHRSILTP